MVAARSAQTSPMPWRSVPVLGVRDVQTALDYYTRTLGFVATGTYGPQDAPVYAVVRRGAAELHLQIRRRNVWAASRGGYERSVYIYADDADALHRAFGDAGARIVQAPTDMPYGLRELVVADVDGHRLAFGADANGQVDGWVPVPVLGCRDVAAGVEWFEAALGFKCPGGPHAPGNDEPVYAIVERAEASIHLQIRRRPVFLTERPAFEGDGYVIAPDVDALHAEFDARGVDVLREPADEPYGLRDFTIATPQGHRLAFATPLETA